MEIPFSLAIFIYLLSLVLLFLILWLVAGKRRKPEDFSALEERIWKCPVCTSTYIDSKNKGISTCPRCGSLNKREDTGEKGLYGGSADAKR